MSDIDPASPVREVFVYLCVRGAEEAIRFYTQVFGAREIQRMNDEQGRVAHAELQLGPAVLMLADEHPEYGILSPLAFGGSGTTVHLHVGDVDGMTARAAQGGAVVLRQPADQPHGERQSRFRDPFGHEWLLGSPVASAAAEQVPVYQLKATLVDSSPPIWRRLLVRSDITLATLHDVLQTAFEWADFHLHMFTVRGAEYGIPDPDDWRELRDEREVQLRSLLRMPKHRVDYEYDFGDSWLHRVVLEKILPPQPELKIAACIGGRRAAPPEDSGGVSGYEAALRARTNPADSNHELYTEWLGDKFDPEQFDQEAVDEALREMR